MRELDKTATWFPSGENATSTRISPILTFFYSVGLLNIFEIPTNPIEIPENYAYNHPTHISILMYVDDGKLTVSSYLLDTNNYILAKAYQLVD